jgi:oligoribonuclease (3'-5' exoribonuclease)
MSGLAGIIFSHHPASVSPLQKVNQEIFELLNGQQKQRQHLPLLAGGSNIKLYLEFLIKKMPEVSGRLSLIEPINIASVRSFIRAINPEDEYRSKYGQTSFDQVHALFEEYKYYKHQYFNHEQSLAQHSLFLAQALEMSHIE